MFFHFIHRQGPSDSDLPLPIDHVSEIPMRLEEAKAMLRTELVIHLTAGWTVRWCGCMMGYHAERDGVRRSVHIEEDAELLLQGLLAPASRRNGLEAVS